MSVRNFSGHYLLTLSLVGCLLLTAAGVGPRGERTFEGTADIRSDSSVIGQGRNGGVRERAGGMLSGWAGMPGLFRLFL
jgi:hypothetical protein